MAGITITNTVIVVALVVIIVDIMQVAIVIIGIMKLTVVNWAMSAKIRGGDGVKLTCVKCVKIDEVFQSCLDDLVVAWDNIGYHIHPSELHCPACGEYLTEETV